MLAKKRYDLHIENKPLEPSDHLALMKFPAMQSQFERFSAKQIHLSYRPKTMKFKLDVRLDTRSPTYCATQALVLGGKSAPKSFPSQESNCIDKNSYVSMTTPIEDGQMFVCKLINNKLICRPVDHLVVLRPDFSHFDIKDEVDPREEIKPVSVKFAAPDRQQSSSSTKTNRDSTRDQENDSSMDEFQPLDYKARDSSDANHQRALLFGQVTPKVKPDPDGEPQDKKPVIQESHFSPDIKPKIERMETEDIYSSDSTLVTSQSSSPKKINFIKSRVKDCLFKAKLVSFEEVYIFIKNSETSMTDSVQLNNKDIIDSLSELALLVQGNWAVKSELLYGDSSERDCTDVTGISINLFIAARDYLLWLFTQNRLVSRLEYSKKVRMPDHDILQLFNQLATFRREIKKWELKLPTDERFLKQFPDIVQRQATIWKVRKANKLSIFN